jgi:hypothetical protein
MIVRWSVTRLVILLRSEWRPTLTLHAAAMDQPSGSVWTDPFMFTVSVALSVSCTLIVSATQAFS